MSGCTVLLVDDAPDIRTLVKLMLELETDMTVVGEASDGQEAVEMCAIHQPDVVVLDISMPVMDGLTAIPRIHQVSPASNIVMLSGFTTDEIKARALELGASRFVEKGAISGDIVDAVRHRC